MDFFTRLRSSTGLRFGRLSPGSYAGRLSWGIVENVPVFLLFFSRIVTMNSIKHRAALLLAGALVAGSVLAQSAPVRVGIL